MKIVKYFNDRVKKLTIFDLKLSQGAAMALMLVIVKLVPSILILNIWWFVGIAIILVVRPAYAFFIKA